MVAIVVFRFSVLSQEIGWEERLRKMTHFVLGGTLNLNPISQSTWRGWPSVLDVGGVSASAFSGLMAKRRLETVIAQLLSLLPVVATRLRAEYCRLRFTFLKEV